ncbi:MAG: hypothetical protein NUV78_02055 [Candidatus Zambryskibacteria bacterium]|nr:hypothetical protein [Candidatus Zambryskibacteria bacterium]
MATELIIFVCGLAILTFFFPPTTRFLNFVQFHLLYKVVKTEEEFIRVARQRGIKSVVVDLIKYPSSIYDPPHITNVIGESTYTLEITAVVSRGQDVVYQEFPFKRYGSSSGFADAEDRNKAAMKLLLLGEKKVTKLQGLLPDIRVTLNGLSGPLGESVLTKLHQDAKTCGISV